jgi:chaperone BCS1
MSIIIVPMNTIKTKKRLEDLFFDTRIDIPQEKRIYVFEEIDCNGWENIVRDRRFIKEVSESNSSEVNAIELLADKLQPLNKNNNKDKDENDKLTLGSILEILDGLIECPGRVVIMTTNHKEHLDSALLRPGRIDMEIEFKKLRRGHIAQIYQKWYNKPMNIKVATDIPDYKFTQAEISQLLFKHEQNPHEFVKELMKCSS